MVDNKNKPFFDDPFQNYWYDEQIVSYITQVMAIFSGMYVKIGKNDFNSETNLVEVPVRYGGADRVVDAIIAGNTQNKPLRLPIFSVRLVNIQQAKDRAKGIATHDRYAYLPRGEALPDGVKVVRRRTPIPYRMAFELSIFTSNESQRFQIMEQIFTIFDPIIQIQTSDTPFDGCKITTVELMQVSMEEQYPAATDKKHLITSMIFEVIGWMQVPLNFKENFIKSIKVRLNALQNSNNFEESVMDDLININSKTTVSEFDIDVDNSNQFPNFPEN